MKSHPNLKMASARLERRVGSVIAAYDGQGNHRTGTAVDADSARWLALEAGRLGVKAKCESFVMKRVEPEASYLRIDGRRVEGVPLFDGGFTTESGISGLLGESGSDADIVLATATTTLAGTASSNSKLSSLSDLRSSRRKGIVLLTEGRRSGLSLLNATRFGNPFGPPVLQVSSAEGEWLHERARRKSPVTLVAKASHLATRAFNVTGKIPGAKKNLPPLVISTPRSGWWQCACERGSGIACWLEIMRVLSASRPARDCLFVALSGHELGFLGINDYLKRRPGITNRVHAWIHLGANLGAPRGSLRIQSSDARLELDVLEALRKEGGSVNAQVSNDGAPRGEASVLKRNGIRYVAPVCGSEVFHHSSDRWPEAVDLSALSRCATAFSNVALKIANQGG